MIETDTLERERELRRARSDYLSVSRNADLYSSTAEHAEAERRAWERLEMAYMAVKQAGEDQA
jgi:hypothetical protein